MEFCFIQSIKDLYHSTKLNELDWINRNRILMKKVVKSAHLSHERMKHLENRKKIMIWSTTSWERGGAEHMMAFSLHARGHEIKIITCDSKLPTCSMESIRSTRPDCEYCHQRQSNLLEIFGLNEFCSRTSSYHSKEFAENIQKDIEQLSPEQLLNYQFRSIQVGKIITRDLPQYYFTSPKPDNFNVQKYMRKAIASTVLLIEIAHHAITEYNPDLGIVASGKTNSFSPFYETCNSIDLPVITWDECGYETYGFILAENNFANEYHLEKIWEKVKHESLDHEKELFLDKYLKKMHRGNVGTTTFYKNPIFETDEIKKSLNLLKENKIVTLLANITWDTSCLGRDTIFNSMMDWILKTIHFFKTTPDITLVIRCHPSEGNVPDFIKSDEKVSDLIIKEFGSVPEHVRLVYGEEQINSHALCQLSDLILVYTTFVGLEMAILGRKVIVSGESHYRNKGFTLDASSQEEYFSILSKKNTYHNKHITKEEIELARRYAYFYINRIHVYLPEFDEETRHTFSIKDPKDFLPNGSTRWDKLSDSIVSDRLFLDCTHLKTNQIEPEPKSV